MKKLLIFGANLLEHVKFSFILSFLFMLTIIIMNLFLGVKVSLFFYKYIIYAMWPMFCLFLIILNSHKLLKPKYKKNIKKVNELQLKRARSKSRRKSKNRKIA